MIIAIRLCQILMWIWLALYGLGMIATLWHSVAELGLWRGWQNFAYGFAPWNVVSFVIRIIELLPALGLFLAAEKLKEIRAKRAATNG